MPTLDSAPIPPFQFDGRHFAIFMVAIVASLLVGFFLGETDRADMKQADKEDA